MNGFAGVIELENSPVKTHPLARINRKLAEVTKSTVEAWSRGGAALGLSASRSLTTDHELWIVADVRLDQRAEFIAQLKAKGFFQANKSSTDSELILHAYRAWGHDCVLKLRGDYSFAIWDVVSRQLFCARDMMGIKPFYYSHDSSYFCFSNLLTSLLSAKASFDDLNESVLCDFLVFGYNLDQRSTVYSHVNRLPASHTLLLNSDGDLTIKEYKLLSFDQHIKYKDPKEYENQFLEHLTRAVKDRLPARNVAFELSGGLDSTSVAAVAGKLGQDIPGFAGKGVTTVTSHIDESDHEADFAVLVARRYGFKFEQFNTGNIQDFYAFTQTAQPYNSPLAAAALGYAERISAHGNVLLTGQGCDPLMTGSGFEILDDYRGQSISQFTLGMARSAWKRGSLRGLGLRALFDRDAARIAAPQTPSWIDKKFLDRSGSIQRWQELFGKSNRYPGKCRAEQAFDELKWPFWTYLFEDYYQQFFSGIECRHPFFDAELIQFLINIPAVHKRNKLILRSSIRGILPEEVRTRPKTLPSIDIVRWVSTQAGVLEQLDTTLENIGGMINKSVYRNTLENYADKGVGDRFNSFSPISLDLWLKSSIL